MSYDLYSAIFGTQHKCGIGCPFCKLRVEREEKELIDRELRRAFGRLLDMRGVIDTGEPVRGVCVPAPPREDK